MRRTASEASEGPRKRSPPPRTPRQARERAGAGGAASGAGGGGGWGGGGGAFAFAQRPGAGPGRGLGGAGRGGAERGETPARSRACRGVRGGGLRFRGPSLASLAVRRTTPSPHAARSARRRTSAPSACRTAPSPHAARFARRCTIAPSACRTTHLRQAARFARRGDRGLSLAASCRRLWWRVARPRRVSGVVREWSAGAPPPPRELGDEAFGRSAVREPSWHDQLTESVWAVPTHSGDPGQPGDDVPRHRAGSDVGLRRSLAHAH